MSRIGRAPVYFEKEVKITVTPDNVVEVKGPKTTEKVPVRSVIKVTVGDGQIVLTRNDEEKETRALHGLYRSLVQNAVTGVSKGFTKSLDLVGVGYRAAVKGKSLELNVGYSHPILFPIPDGIEIKVDKNTNVVVNGSSKALVGQVAAKIRSFRSPEPYLGKGIKYTDEMIRRKAGKSAGK